ncbi:MAG: hypothetical protein VZS44_11375 [Bacilli bacterium]|nr:hypothetical protein [Bacilli bacterium]
MTNQEVFEEYNTEKWVIEQNLCFMLQKYWEECRAKYGDINLKITELPINPVGFVKQFLKEETICDIEIAEKSKLDTINKSVIGDADYIEIN